MSKPKWDNRDSQDLFGAILMLRSKSEVKKFLRDLLTEQEISEFSRRWRAVRMLDSGRPYTEIVKTTGLSSTTVARIAKWMKSGMGGYRMMLGRVPGLR